MTALLVLVLGALAGLHFYVDHQLLHILVSIEQVRQNQLREGK